MESPVTSLSSDDIRLSSDGSFGIRQSHDEPNLAEFPLVLLTTKSPKDRHTIEYQDSDRHPRTGVEVVRKVTITGAGKFGLPAGVDEDVLMALIYLTLEDKTKTGFDDPMVYFTRPRLLEILGWPDTGHYYKRLKESLNRWKGVNIYYENWWDHQAQDYIPDLAFGILDNYKLSDARRKETPQFLLPLEDDRQPQLLCYVKWNMTPLAGFKNGTLKTLDLNTFFRLPSAAAKRAYRYLNLHLPTSGHQEFDLRTFACQHVGFASGYKPGRLRTQVQEAIVAPLEQSNFIERMPSKRRFITQDGHDRIVFARKATDELSPAAPDQAAPLSLDASPLFPLPADATALLGELTRRHLGGKLAAKFVAAHSVAYLEQKIDYFDFTASAQSIKNPAGWLRKAIEEDYGPPAGYIPREERDRQAKAKEQKEQAFAAARRQEREREAHEQQEKKAILAYWESLTPQEQADLDAAALAQADPETVAMETGAWKSFGQTIRRHAYIREVLQSLEPVNAEA